MSDVQDRVIEIIKKHMQEIDPGKEIGLGSEISSLGIHSLLFIKIVIDIECEFDIEFAGDDLDFGKFITIKDLCDHVSNKYESNEI